MLENPFINAYVYRLLYGPIALPCSGPLVVGLFTYSLTAAEVIGKLSIFFWFGLGFGIPLLLLSLLSRATLRWIVRFFAENARMVNLVGLLMLVRVGIYDFISTWTLVKTCLGVWFGI